jgi:hypothetical protein
MQAAHCALSVALKKFLIVPELSTAKQHLERAVVLSEEYYKVQYSIFWKTSPSQLKKNIRQKMNELAFDCYSEILCLADAIEVYTTNQNALKVPVIKGWNELILHLQLAFEWIEREHPREIRSKQLSLF